MIADIDGLTDNNDQWTSQRPLTCSLHKSKANNGPSLLLLFFLILPKWPTLTAGDRRRRPLTGIDRRWQTIVETFNGGLPISLFSFLSYLYQLWKNLICTRFTSSYLRDILMKQSAKEINRSNPHFLKIPRYL